MKKSYTVHAKSGNEQRQFNIYTNQANRDRIAEQVAKNVFYCDNITIINIYER